MSAVKTLQDWAVLLRQFKEKLAERLWAVSTLDEAEKESLYKNYLSDLDRFESNLSSFEEELLTKQKLSQEENDLLRSLLGVNENDLKAKSLTLNQDLSVAAHERDVLKDEALGLRKKLADAEEENKYLRERLHDVQKKSDAGRVDQIKMREDDIKYFAETHASLKNELKDLESRLLNLRELFTQTNQQLLNDKQGEISLLQKRLLEEMEAALRKRQELSWGEEEMFAKGVAHRVRTALVSLQGQLLLTLERLGFLDPRTKEESFWKGRIRLLVEGASTLRDNFMGMQGQLEQVTHALDDYMHLTGRRTLVKEPLLLKEIVQGQMADVYADRRASLSVEFLSDDPMPAVPGDASLIKFAIHTLLENALEALPNKSGQIVIALKNLSQDGRVQMTVRDSGAGVPPHLLPRMFEPFFTTKEHRQGLSLSRAKRYVELHGGLLQLLSSDKTGTIFQMDLPLQGASLVKLLNRPTEKK